MPSQPPDAWYTVPLWNGIAEGKSIGEAFLEGWNDMAVNYKDQDGYIPGGTRDDEHRPLRRSRFQALCPNVSTAAAAQSDPGR